MFNQTQQKSSQNKKLWDFSNYKSLCSVKKKKKKEQKAFWLVSCSKSDTGLVFASW